MKTIIAGLRGIEPSKAEELVRKAVKESGWEDQITEIIHGCAPGIDSAAGRIYKDKLPITAIPANWNKHGNYAGPLRNKQMAEVADALIAVWDGRSKGTGNMISTAKKLGLKIYVSEIC
jgi:hypothetical protein